MAEILRQTGYTITEVGLVIMDELPLEAYERIGIVLAGLDRGIPWAVGDWMLYGERRADWGEKAAQAQDASKISPETALHYRWVCQRIEPFRRRPGLTFSHHAAVAGMDPADQERLLTEAELNGWTVRELRRRAGEGRRPSPPAPATAAGSPAGAPAPGPTPLEVGKRAWELMTAEMRQEFVSWLRGQDVEVPVRVLVLEPSGGGADAGA